MITRTQFKRPLIFFGKLQNKKILLGVKINPNEFEVLVLKIGKKLLGFL